MPVKPPNTTHQVLFSPLQPLRREVTLGSAERNPLAFEHPQILFFLFCARSPSRVPSPPPIYCSSSVPRLSSHPFLREQEGLRVFLHDRVQGKHPEHLQRWEVTLLMEAPAWSSLWTTILRVFLWVFSEDWTAVVWPMLRKILRLKWVFHCPVLVGFMCLCSETFRWSRTEPEECQLGRMLDLSRERQCLCHALRWTTVLPLFGPKTFALNPALKPVVGD